jgi:Serine protease inhibitor
LRRNWHGWGWGIAFDPGRADFSGMSERHAKDLFIGTVKHKTFVRVDEKGTEAAAVTSVGMRLTSLPLVERQLVFDRPFVYGIMDLKAGIPLFVGIMENPAARP